MWRCPPFLADSTARVVGWLAGGLAPPFAFARAGRGGQFGRGAHARAAQGRWSPEAMAAAGGGAPGSAAGAGGWRLPGRVLEFVFSYLDLRELRSCALVCKMWYRVLHGDENSEVWRSLAARSLAEEALRTDILCNVPTYKGKVRRGEGRAPLFTLSIPVLSRMGGGGNASSHPFPYVCSQGLICGGAF